MSDQLKVIVQLGGYLPVAESEDQLLCARVLAMVIEHGAANPPSPQQKLEEELRKQIEELKSEAWSAKNSLDKFRKEAAKVGVMVPQ